MPWDQPFGTVCLYYVWFEWFHSDLCINRNVSVLVNVFPPPLTLMPHHCTVSEHSVLSTVGSEWIKTDPNRQNWTKRTIMDQTGGQTCELGEQFNSSHLGHCRLQPNVFKHGQLTRYQHPPFASNSARNNWMALCFFSSRITRMVL